MPLIGLVGRQTKLAPREKLQPLRDDGLVGSSGDSGDSCGVASGRETLTTQTPHIYTPSQYMGEDVLHKGEQAANAVNRSWDGGSAPPQPLFVPPLFRGVSDLRPMAWGSANTSSGHILRQVERIGVHSHAAPWGPYDAPPMHPPNPSSMFFQERLAMKPVLAYEKTQDGRVKTKDSSWKEGVAQHGDSAKVIREIMHLLWSDQPVSQLATNLESLSSAQRHSVLEIVIGLMRNTGVIANTLTNMTASLDVYKTGQAIIGGVSRLVESSSCILHVCSEDPRGEDLLWRLQHAEATIDPSLAKAHRQPDTMIMRAPTNYKGLVGACLKHQEPMVVWDAQQDARYCAEVDSAENSVRHGATIACVPLVDERWQVSGAQPHAIGVLQLVVNTGPDRGRKKRLGLELRALLLVLGRQAGQCLTNAMSYTLQAERALRLDANQTIMRRLSRSNMTEEHMAAVVAIETGLGCNAQRAAVFLVKEAFRARPGTGEPVMTRVEVSMQDRGQSVRVTDDIPITEGHPGQVYAQGVTLNVADVAAHSAHVSMGDGNVHLLTVPIIAHLHDKQNLEHTALAVIQLARSADIQPWRSVEERFVEELATLMAPLLDSLRMEKLAEHATEKVLAQRVLCDQLGQDATQETPLVDIEKILLQTLGSAGELVHAKVCTVFLVDNSSAELVSAHEFASGQIRERDEEIRVPLTSGILSESAELGESVSAAVAKEHHAYRDEVDQRAGVIENSSIVITPVFVSDPALERISQPGANAAPGQRSLGRSLTRARTPVAAPGVVAILVLQHKKDGSAFSAGDVGVLETFARIAASDVGSHCAFENHRAQAHRASNQYGILLQATCDMLAKPHGLEHTLEAAAQAGTKLFDCMKCEVYLYDEKADVLWRDTQEGAGERTTTTVSPGEGLLGAVLQNGQTTRVMKLGPHGKESFLTAPLITESAELVGVLQLRDKRSVLDELVTSFDEADELVLPAFLLHVANALANALQLVRMKLRDDANKVLQVASPRITSELEFVGLSRAVAEQGKLLFSAERCYLFLVDKEQMQLLGHDDETRLSLPLTSVAGIAVEGGVPLILHDAQGDSRYAPDANTALGAAVQTMICIPLRTNDCIGVVLATNRIFPGGVCPSERASFTDLDVEMGSALARIVAVHLHRQQEQQSSQLAPHYSKEGLLLLLDDKGIIESSSSPSFLFPVPEETARRTNIFEWLDASGNASLGTDIRRVYDTGEAVVSSDGPLQTPQGPVRVCYCINALTQQSPSALVTFPGVDVKRTHASGVVVWIQLLPERQRNRAMVQRMLTSEAASSLFAQDVHTKPQQMHLSTLHCTIRNLDAYNVPGMVTLNAFLEKAGVCIGEAGGAIDKYVPDGVVAHFGIAEHLTSQARNCPSSTELRALQAALSILEVADAMNAQRAARKTSSLVVGISITTSKMLVGRIGSSLRYELGVFGEGASRATQLATCTNHYFPVTTSLLVDQATMDACWSNDDSLVWRELDSLMLPQAAAPMCIYHLLHKDRRKVPPNLQRALLVYADALQMYKAGEWAQAMPHFRQAHTLSVQRESELQEATPKADTAAEVMVQRCKALLEKPPTEWHGSFCVSYLC